MTKKTKAIPFKRKASREVEDCVTQSSRDFLQSADGIGYGGSLPKRGIDISPKNKDRRVAFSVENSQILYIPSNNVLKQVERARGNSMSVENDSPEGMPSELLDPDCPLTSIFLHKGNLLSISPGTSSDLFSGQMVQKQHKTSDSQCFEIDFEDGEFNKGSLEADVHI
ncbi:hypothetical protein AX774_g202 [Zancudomyces culisetae]|uniref:Uncharacterized protein n=1 Tax=Zancudomyces culisetae TaxID=1213189 RepID=A0A1R1PZD1_ZANCU|nr:hypothetical protein AX774_g202 [Zancudomyces culisetae]|eukprot:OMH86310.1 hypothetical protein AX774_g202 [Zancudomyces culisetae]